MYIQLFQHLKVKVEVIPGNLKQAALKKIDFKRSVEHRG